MIKKLTRKNIIILAVIIILTGYSGYKSLMVSSQNKTNYVTTAVQKSTLIVSVSGSGQVSTSDQIDIKSKVSSDIIYLGITSGQEIKKGTLIARLDTQDTQQSVQNAQISLDQTKIDLQKMQGLTTTEGSIRGAKEKAISDLQQVYEDGFNAVANDFLQLPSIMSGLQDILLSNTLSGGGQWNLDFYANSIQQYDSNASVFRDDAYAKYLAARKSYDQSFTDYKAADRSSSVDTIEQLINKTYETTRLIAEAVKSANNLIQLYKDRLAERNLRTNSLADTHLSQLSSYTSQTNSYLSNLLSLTNTIQSDKEAIINVQFDLPAQENKVLQAEQTLSKTKENLANCYIYAPFDGIAAKVSVKLGDSISSGTAIATFITKQQIAEITLNEVDVAKIKLGQKATLTFDAVSDLTLTGEVTEIETLGTVSQGVVSYAVKITFDTQDERVKPGMSVSSAIITDSKNDVLFVPNSAVKQQGDSNYVQIMINGVPQNRNVEIGLSNDTNSEILSGLKEGDQVVTQTITANSTNTSQTQSNTGFRIPGFGGGR